MSVVSVLTHGNVTLAQVTVPHMRYHSNEDGIPASSIDMPEGSIIAAVETADGVEVVGEDTVLSPGDRAIVVSDSDALNSVRALFRSL